MELISIIIPVYKVEPYIRKCIDSVISQTYKNIEIILVDDGSPDNCGKICDEYAEKDSRIRVIHKTNGGLSDARNKGLDIAEGEYITFIDSDDYVERDYVEAMYNVIKKTDCDYSVCSLRTFREGEEVSADNVNEKISVYDQYDAIKLALKNEINQCSCGKLYKRSLFEEIRFPYGKLYEDVAVHYSLLLRSEKIGITTKIGYNYLIRKGSILRSEFKMKNLDEIPIIEEQMSEVLEKYPDLQKQTDGRKLYTYFITLRRILDSSQPDKFIRQRKIIRKRIKRCQKGLLFCDDIPLYTKIKIISYFLGERGYMFVQRIADLKNPEMNKKFFK